MNTWIFLPAYFELLPLFDIIRMFMSVCVDLATLFDTLGQASHRENIRKDQHNLPLCRERPVTGDYPDKGSVMWKTLHHNAPTIYHVSNKENTNVRHYWLFVRGTTGGRWFPFKGQSSGKPSYSMTSLWYIYNISSYASSTVSRISRLQQTGVDFICTMPSSTITIWFSYPRRAPGCGQIDLINSQTHVGWRHTHRHITQL